MLTRKQAGMVFLGVLARGLQTMVPKGADYAGEKDETADTYANFHGAAGMLSEHPATAALNHASKKFSRMGTTANRLYKGQDALTGKVGENVLYNDGPDLVNYAAIATSLMAEGNDPEVEALILDGQGLLRALDGYLRSQGLDMSALEGWEIRS